MSNQSVVNAIRATNLSDKQIIANMSDPPDAKRRKTMDKLAQQAAAGDQAALLRLEALSGYDAKKEKALGGADPYADLRGDFKAQFGTANPGAATADAQNYARLLVSNLTGQPVPSYLPPKDAYVGDDIGGVLKAVAPVAGALIPGVGLLGAAAIGGLGNAAGQYASTGKINVGQSLLAGGMAAGGNALLGNGLGSGGTGAFGSTPAGVAGTGPAGTGWGGSATMGGNAPAALGAGAQAAASAGGIGGALGTAGNLLTKYGPLVLGGIGAVGAGKLGSQAEDLRNQAARVAMQDYQQRAPLREAAVTGLTGPRPQREDLSGLYADPSNPYRRPVARMGG